MVARWSGFATAGKIQVPPPSSFPSPITSPTSTTVQSGLSGLNALHQTLLEEHHPVARHLQ